MVNRAKIVSATLLIMLALTGLIAQETDVNVQETDVKIAYNSLYRYPVSVGVELQLVSPLTLLNTDYMGDYSILDIGVQARFPIPPLPVLQPLVRLGVVLTKAQLASANTVANKFDNTRIYLSAGLGYMHKFSKQLEAGVDLKAGFGYSIFPRLDPQEAETYAAWNFQVSLGGRIVFNPNYNFSINFHPSIRFYHSFSPLERFNGFAVGIGFTADYRFGVDPDDPKVEIRSIQFDQPRVDDLFAAMQSYYVSNPIGEVTFRNTEKYRLEDVVLTFFQPGYMNIATQVAQIAQLDSGEQVTIPLTAAFDQRVFTLEGVTPLTGEVGVEYTARTRRASQKVAVTYDLYDKNSLTWDDDRKVAAFITSGDSALGNYLSYLRQTTRDVVNPGYSEAMQTALMVYYGLSEIGTIYQRDPTLSYEDAKGDIRMIDSVNLPRETLVKLSGDCDDLTVLFNALLESSGLETGFITAPGHIYSMFSTGLPAREYKRIHPDKGRTIPIDGVLWVPVEITYIGERGFEEAWRSGAEEFARYSGQGDAMGLYLTRNAQLVYRPVGFEEQDLGLQYGDRSKTMRDFNQSMSTIVRSVIEDYEQQARRDNSKGSWNRLGIISAELGDFSVSETALFTALSLDRNYLPAKINLANVYYKQEEYQNALRLYHESEQSLREGDRGDSISYARVLLNISKTYHEVENFDQASRFFERLSEVNSQLASRYPYLTDRVNSVEAGNQTAQDNLFIEE